MFKPLLLVVEQDPGLLERLQSDLARAYGERYRVSGASSASEAIEILSQSKASHEPLALLIVDHGLPDQSGAELLGQAAELFPDAKRVLLAEYKNADEAVNAVKALRIDHYLLKPCQPPEQFLYPLLNDLIADWEGRPAQFQGVLIVGYRFSPQSHETRDFLVRNGVPFQWVDIERDEEGRRLLAASGMKTSGLPIVIFPDGSQLVQPTHAELAQKLGLRVHPKDTSYDLVIIGGGPAGLASAVYGASEGLRTIMVERNAPGGQAGLSTMIENYLGFPAGLSGTDLARRAIAQAKKFEAEIVTPQNATAVRVNGSSKLVTLGDGSELRCEVVLLALGVDWRRLDAPGIERLTGAGVYYGGTLAEAFFCRDEDVFIVGGANSAGQAALYFARYARTVTMLVRGESLSKEMSHYLLEQIQSTPNIIPRLRTTVLEAHGEDRLEAITVFDAGKNQQATLPAKALFIFIGAMPHTDYLDGVVKTDKYGFILTGPDLAEGNGDGHRPEGWPLDRNPFWLETSVPGIFAAGDVRHGSVKRVAAGVGEGSTAVRFIHEYLSSNPLG